MREAHHSLTQHRKQHDRGGLFTPTHRHTLPYLFTLTHTHVFTHSHSHSHSPTHTHTHSNTYLLVRVLNFARGINMVKALAPKRFLALEVV